MADYFDVLFAGSNSGGSATLQEKSVSITQNGDSTILPDSGYDGMSKVDVSVNVSGGGEAPENDVEFIDYDGTIVYSYTAQEFLALDAMPANPTHEGLTAQGWNWTLADAKEYVTDCGMITIGQMYITDDGKTRLYIHLEDRVSPKVVLWLNGSCEIDWGDNTSIDTITGSGGTVSSSHTYATGGDYVISLAVTGSARFIDDGLSNLAILQESNTTAVPNGSWYYREAIHKIEIGSGFSQFNSRAFSSAHQLRTITIPDSITNTGSASYLFNNCYLLKAVVLPSQSSGLNSNIFANCSSLEKVSNSKLGGVTASSCFGGCYSLQRVNFPRVNNSTYLLASSGIRKVAVPSQGVSTYTFSSCSNLQYANLVFADTDYGAAVSSNAFNNCKSLQKVNLSNPYNTIGSYAFGNCFSLSEINLGNIKTISDNAFSYCYSLESIDLSNLTSMGNAAFTNCWSLKEIKLGNKLTTLPLNAFNSCYSLTKITIPSGITTINGGAFYGSSLKTIVFENDTPPTLTASGVFNNLPTDCVIYVPYSEDHSVLNAYKTATNYPNPSTYTYVEY